MNVVLRRTGRPGQWLVVVTDRTGPVVATVCDLAAAELLVRSVLAGSRRPARVYEARSM